MENKIIKKWYRIKIMSIVALFEYLVIALVFLAICFNLLLNAPTRLINMYAENGMIDLSEINIRSVEFKWSSLCLPLIIIAIIFVLYLFFAKRNLELIKSKSNDIWKFFKVEQILLLIFILLPFLLYLCGYFI